MSAPIVVVRQPGRTPLHLALHEPVEIGRDCGGLLLTDPQTSRRHLVLSPDNRNLTVTDLGSRNGTTVDGSRLEAPHRLLPGEVVRLGDTTIELVSEPGEHGASPAVETMGDLGQEMRATAMDLIAAAVVQEPSSIAADESDTVTIVFSDIENSTSRAVEMGDAAWMEVLRVHNAIVRRQVTRFHGTEVKTQGDSFMLTFSSARSAVSAMIETQRALDTWARSQPANAVRVRIGVHTGEAIRQHDDLFGKHVILAARVAGAARGGEILVSSLVREIVEARGDLTFGEPRSLELKGLPGVWIVHPVAWKPEPSPRG